MCVFHVCVCVKARVCVCHFNTLTNAQFCGVFQIKEDSGEEENHQGKGGEGEEGQRRGRLVVAVHL